MGVNDKPLILLDEPDHWILRDWSATFRELHCHAFSPENGNDVRWSHSCPGPNSPGVANLRAITAGRCLPNPISANKSFFDLAPLSRANFSHCAAVIVLRIHFERT